MDDGGRADPSPLSQSEESTTLTEREGRGIRQNFESAGLVWPMFPRNVEGECHDTRG
jgi:hypothetical protein